MRIPDHHPSISQMLSNKKSEGDPKNKYEEGGESISHAISAINQLGRALAHSDESPLQKRDIKPQ